MLKSRVFVFVTVVGLLMTLFVPISNAVSSDLGPSEFPRGNEVPVKIMLFNIKHGAGTDNVLDLDRTANN